ncbi:hypothetical protein [Entomohabitans teleogrylli]|uniref:hypothetical protein n=1 Tax=Entomohabitans teleogrylli TaxID=1384589 RepID=UPI00073D25C4|nr:hypothetical protein [Entomohabitans teleogrylli]
MKYLNITFWTGMIIALVYVLFITIYLRHFTSFYDDMPELVRPIIVVYWSGMILSIIATLLFSLWRKTSVVLMFCGVLLTLPGSIVMLYGFQRSNCAYRFHWLQREPHLSPQTASVRINTDKIILPSAIMAVLGAVMFFIGIGPSGLILVAGLMMLWNGQRLKKHPLLDFQHDEILLTPTLYSDTYRIPARYIRDIESKRNKLRLTLQHNEHQEKIALTMNLFPNGVTAASLGSSLREWQEKHRL